MARTDGPVLGACIWNLRRHLPESPRWLIIHGREEEAEKTSRSSGVDAEGKSLEDVATPLSAVPAAA